MTETNSRALRVLIYAAAVSGWFYLAGPVADPLPVDDFAASVDQFDGAVDRIGDEPDIPDPVDPIDASVLQFSEAVEKFDAVVDDLYRPVPPDPDPPLPPLPPVPAVPAHIVDEFDAAVPNNTTAELYGWVWLDLSERLGMDAEVVSTVREVSELIALAGKHCKAETNESNPLLPAAIAGVMDGLDGTVLTPAVRAAAAKRYETIGAALVRASRR